MGWKRAVVLGLLFGLGCAAAGDALLRRPTPVSDEPLYFALEVRQAGHVVSRPQLVGLSGHPLRARLTTRTGAPRLELVLHPVLHPSDLDLHLQLALPGRAALERDLPLRHGEQVRLALASDVEVSVLAMKVHSPEFEAYVDHAPERDATAGAFHDR